MDDSTMRERWFFVRGGERRGPLARDAVVRAVNLEADPHSVLVWRKGLPDWARAEAVPEIESQLARLHAPREPPVPGAIDAGSPSVAPAAAPPVTRSWTPVLLGLLVLALVALALSWRSRAASNAPAPPASVAGVGTETSQVPPPSPDAAAPSPVSPRGPLVTSEAAQSGPAPSAVADTEGALPQHELGRLRGVASWARGTFRLTVVNETAWRVTEIAVRIERFSGEAFVADPHPLQLLPPAVMVDAPVAGLLERVAPERRRAGLNPLDTGVFEGHLGPPPEGFRWEIDSARGYPPQRFEP